MPCLTPEKLLMSLGALLVTVGSAAAGQPANLAANPGFEAVRARQAAELVV